MKTTKYIGLMMMAAGMLAATSCSDFDDYNTVRTDATATGSQTIWENLQQNPQLSDFAALVEQAGFSEALNTTHNFTVWAPLNGTFDPAAYSQLSKEALLTQLIYNQIAEYNHPATSTVEERLVMLNKKKYDFIGTGSYTFGNVAMTTPNVGCSNGVLHLTEGVPQWRPNLYEYLTDSMLNAGKELDSLRNYFLRQQVVSLDESNSVVGPIVDGVQTYVDSVMLVNNTLTSTLRARFDNEDSTYTMLLPTNKAWKDSYDRIKSHFRYVPTTRGNKYTTERGVTSMAVDEVTMTAAEAAHLQDSLALRFTVSNLVYSNNDGYNTWIEGQINPAVGTDTLRSTTREKLTNTAGILGQTKESVELSNGTGRIIDSLAVLPWETYSPEFQTSAVSTVCEYHLGTIRGWTVDMRGTDMDSYSYLAIEASGGYNKPDATFYLPRTLRSTTYNIYCVFHPAWDAAADYASRNLPNRVIFEMTYCDEKGDVQTIKFRDESQENIDAFQAAYREHPNNTAHSNLADNTTNADAIRGFSNNPSIIDTLLIGQFTFPVCYYGVNDDTHDVCPTIKVSSPFSALNATLRASYNRDLRIAGFILRPVELEEFEEANKEESITDESNTEE